MIEFQFFLPWRDTTLRVDPADQIDDAIEAAPHAAADVVTSDHDSEMRFAGADSKGQTQCCPARALEEEANALSRASLIMAWSPARRANARRFEVHHPGDYATLNFNQSRDSTRVDSRLLFAESGLDSRTDER